MDDYPKPSRQALAVALDEALPAAGIPAWGFVGEAAFREACSALPGEARERYGLDRTGGAVAVALPYGEGPPEPPAWARDWLSRRPGPLARIGRFARANLYAELIARLKSSAAGARAALAAGGADPGPARDWRCLANSGLPERALALAAGLGELGRNGLVMARGLGPGCVLGLLLLPFDVSDSSNARASEGVTELAAASTPPATGGVSALGEACASCEACVRACPTAALGPGGFRRERCIQHWAALDLSLPPEIQAAWGSRLYGCDACLEACPRFRPEAGVAAGRGALGPGLPAEWLAEAPEAEIRERLRGTALGMGWISIPALRRNARFAI